MIFYHSTFCALCEMTPHKGSALNICLTVGTRCRRRPVRVKPLAKTEASTTLRDILAPSNCRQSCFTVFDFRRAGATRRLAASVWLDGMKRIEQLFN
jgi:hypothetical protein